MHRKRILEKIWQAMEFACEQSEHFTSNKADTIPAEYLFTVAVAMAIAEHNGPPGEPYVIRLERDATTFMKDCVRSNAHESSTRATSRSLATCRTSMSILR